MKTLTLLVGCCALAASQAQTRFDSAEAAAQALIHAAANNNTAQLEAIFGPQGKTLLISGDPQQNKAEREEFASIAKNKHELQRDAMNPDRMILSIGSQDWPFPVPIVKTGGKWMFDSSMGEQVMQARHIGADELDAIEICAGYVGAQKRYAQQHTQQYATRIADLEVPSQFIQAVGPTPQSYHGYYFATLHAQGRNAVGGEQDYMATGTMMGGFALVAWPAEYGVSGVHTFIISREGLVYEKDLGAPSDPKIAPVTRYDPDKTWTPVN